VRAIAAALALLVPAAGQAVADDVMALVYSRGSGRAAIAVARPDSAAAVAAARQECGADCETMAVAAAGSCFALAREPSAGFGWARGANEAETRAAAVGFCRRRDAARACPVIAARCLPTSPAPESYGRDTPRPIADPAHAIVVIFIHGAQPAELGPDPCEMDHVNAPFGVPNVVHALDGASIAGHRVWVDGFCPPTRIGPIDPRTGQRTNRLDPRVRETGARAAAYAAMGVPPARIFLVGHSLGGWGSLVVERRQPELIGGVIAFAPAAFGIAATRPPGVAADRLRRYAELTAAPRLRALIFGFAEDAYETADDLRALAAVSGVEFVAIPQPGPAGRRCVMAPHARLRDPCFAETQAQRIRAFIAARIAGGKVP
jgi:pimeloyl-ACP methyl ester carboxylesterase